jgi:5-methylcytosine-specific restriction endonuclease McrA
MDTLVESRLALSSKKGDPRLSRDYKRVRLQVLARDGHTCHYCGQDATTVDHVIPIAKGGDPISHDNMVAACRSCNSSKGSRSEGLFLQRQITPPVFSERPSPTQSRLPQTSPFIKQISPS